MNWMGVTFSPIFSAQRCRYPKCGVTSEITSPSVRSTSRRTPCVLGCCGPMLTSISSVRTSNSMMVGSCCTAAALLMLLVFQIANEFLMLCSFPPLGFDNCGLNSFHHADVVEHAVITHVVRELLDEAQNTFFSNHDNSASSASYSVIFQRKLIIFSQRVAFPVLR